MSVRLYEDPLTYSSEYSAEASIYPEWNFADDRQKIKRSWLNIKHFGRIYF